LIMLLIPRVSSYILFNHKKIEKIIHSCLKIYFILFCTFWRLNKEYSIFISIDK